jgi:choice-of-anchor A domain-containing protein
MSCRHFASALLLFVAAAPASALTVIDYSLFTLGHYTDTGGSTIDGGVAVTGDALINSTSIGAALGVDRNNTTVVAVGGNISYDNSTLQHGNVVYGGSNNSGQYTQATTPGGSFTKGPSIPFAAYGAGLVALSGDYAALASTGSFTSLNGIGTLTGGAVAGVDVFDLTTSDLSGVYSLSLIGTVGSKAIINVTGASYASYLGFNRGNYAVSDITFNFVDATALTFGGIDLGASVLAPLAKLSQQGGHIRGAVAVGSFEGAGGHVGGDGAFAIDAGPLPEPSSWVMLIAGFGLTGALLRRRRAFQPS